MVYNRYVEYNKTNPITNQIHYILVEFKIQTKILQYVRCLSTLEPKIIKLQIKWQKKNNKFV